jgi:hypothetical protein
MSFGDKTKDYPSRPSAAAKKLEPQISQISQIKKKYKKICVICVICDFPFLDFLPDPAFEKRPGLAELGFGEGLADKGPDFFTLGCAQVFELHSHPGKMTGGLSPRQHPLHCTRD